MDGYWAHTRAFCILPSLHFCYWYFEYFNPTKLLSGVASTSPCSSSSKFYVTECSSGQAPSEMDSGGTSAEPQLDLVSISENFTVDPNPESEKENELRILEEQMAEIQEEKEKLEKNSSSWKNRP
jgi:hypothetical protein